MVKDISKAGKRGIAGNAQSGPRVLGEMDRERSVGAEQTEEVHGQPRRIAAASKMEGRESCGGEREMGLLGKTHRFISRAQRLAQPGERAMRAL
jgi:hypothetical protein